MKIVNSLYSSFKNEEKEIKYSYRLTEESYLNGQAFGIEVEKQDIVDGEVVAIERDYIEKISNIEDKVRELLSLIHNYQVSPVHLVDILGEYVDNYVVDFN
ncbi:MAG: DUF6514 family protein [Clostridium sp.]|uniref:DUF6514 family protein n=1 Tax=Clostridium sp. TaxID=1506 RepID=UPI002912E055|nr:DUF6514 family protein [Clostridium sp.]MDU5109047.1 DUF6514 family protein [Clostridium sp.]